MANEGVNQGRRRFLTATTVVVGGAGAITAAIPFIKSWQPSARAKNAGAPVLADISKVEPGQRLTIAWRGQPVWIVNRTPQLLATLPQADSRLTDPNSDVAQQPPFAKNETRSYKDKPQWFVVIGICTHLGCSPEFVPEIKPEPYDPEWKGGFYCPCHKSRMTSPAACSRASRRRPIWSCRLTSSWEITRSSSASVRREQRNG
jgi:ubiquinol-cytochrome c reductase, iron-sulfur subunit